ncbi:MAG: hypothetical protein JW994_05710 [Candidatus Omnitrophica bacterium]|nr:hypothetical protein [Candidatus Omnitrophota bacterium]
MRISPRTTLVILVSSLIISSVLALTLLGYYVYLGWKEKKISWNYRMALYNLNADIFGKYIQIKLQAKIEKDGIFKGKPVVLGTIKNTSNKKIYSLKLKVVFYDSKQRAMYSDTFCPVGVDLESLVNIGELASNTKNFLTEGDSVSFKHILRNCPSAVMLFLKSKSKFAKLEKTPLKLDYGIEGIDIK